MDDKILMQAIINVTSSTEFNYKVKLRQFIMSKCPNTEHQTFNSVYMLDLSTFIFFTSYPYLLD
jgi:hypothetical protein